MTGLERRIAVARGDAPADLVVRGGRVLSRVHARVARRRRRDRRRGDRRPRRATTAREVVDAGGSYVVPGFIDAHMHLESTKLLPDTFARLVLPLGTTAVVADPHEIANVLGVDGVHWLLDASSDLQLEMFFMASVVRPASPFESPRRPLTSGDLEALMRRRRVLGLAEMMNYPGVIAGEPGELEKLALEGAQHVDGHAPGVLGRHAAGLRRGGDRLRPRGTHRGGGPRAAARGHVAAHPRGVDGPQPAWRSSRSCRSSGPAGSRSAPTTATRTTSRTTATSTGWCARRSPSG